MKAPAVLLSILIALGTVVASHAQPPPGAEFGVLEYPARGNIQLDEGTLDLWLTSDFDTDTPPDKSNSDNNYQANLFSIVFPEENWHYPLYYISWANAFALVGYAQPQQRYVWVGPPHWKPGETHHLTCTWSGRKRSVFIDGKCEWKGPKGPNIAKDVEVEGELHGDLTSAILRIGSTRSSVTVDEIQVRRVALTTAEIVAAKDAPLTADVHTLLLDHCDGGPAEVIGGQTGETGGKLSGKYEIVDGKFGKAIRLWKEKK